MRSESVLRTRFKKVGLEQFVDGRVFQRLDHFAEFSYVLELTIDRGVANKRDRIDSLESLHYLGTNHATRDFLQVLRRELVHNFIDSLFENIDRYRTLFAGFDESAEQLFAFERLAGSIALDNEHVASLHLLVGREPMGAVQTFTPPPNGKTILRQTGIDHLVTKAIAFDTAHLGKESQICDSQNTIFNKIWWCQFE